MRERDRLARLSDALSRVFPQRGQWKYELLTLASRVADRSMASVEIIDLREDSSPGPSRPARISAALHVAFRNV